MTHEDERTNQAPITDPARNSPGLREDHTSEHVPLTGSFVEHDPEDDELLLGLDGEPDNDWLREAQMSSWFVDPIGTAAVREADGLPPVDEDDYARWLAEQSPEKLHFLGLAREQQTRTVRLGEQVRKALLTSVPELYEARLPQKLEAKLDGINYAIGFNQTMASTAEEAAAYLHETRGIDFTNYSLAHRFLMYDQSMHDDAGTLGQDSSSGIARAIESGYFGNPEIGRFVAVFPETDTEARGATGDRLANAVSLDETILPDDAIVRYEDERGQHTSLNSKYVAGFIDETGSFWYNNSFLVSDQAVLSPLT